MHKQLKLHTNPFRDVTVSPTPANTIGVLPDAQQINTNLALHKYNQKEQIDAAIFGIQMLDPSSKNDIAVLLDCYYIVGTKAEGSQKAQAFLQLERGLILAHTQQFSVTVKKFLTAIKAQFNPYISVDNLELITSIAKNNKFEQLAQKCEFLILIHQLIYAKDNNAEQKIHAILKNIEPQLNSDIDVTSLNIIANTAAKYNHRAIQEKCVIVILEKNLITENEKYNNYDGIKQALNKINENFNDEYISDANLPLISKLARRYSNNGLEEKCLALQEKRKETSLKKIANFQDISKKLSVKKSEDAEQIKKAIIYPPVTSQMATQINPSNNSLIINPDCQEHETLMLKQ